MTYPKSVSYTHLDVYKRQILAFKAYALWRTFPIFKEYIHASTASSPWEARLGYEEMGAPVHAYTPAYSEDNIANFVRYSSHITLNSPTQWQRFGPTSPQPSTSLMVCD